MNNQMELAIAAIKTGMVSPFTAFKMVDKITEDQKDTLRAENEKLMRDVCDHQDKMQGVMSRGF